MLMCKITTTKSILQFSVDWLEKNRHGLPEQSQLQSGWKKPHYKRSWSERIHLQKNSL